MYEKVAKDNDDDYVFVWDRIDIKVNKSQFTQLRRDVHSCVVIEILYDFLAKAWQVLMQAKGKRMCHGRKRLLAIEIGKET